MTMRHALTIPYRPAREPSGRRREKPRDGRNGLAPADAPPRADRAEAIVHGIDADASVAPHPGAGAAHGARAGVGRDHRAGVGREFSAAAAGTRPPEGRAAASRAETRFAAASPDDASPDDASRDDAFRDDIPRRWPRVARSRAGRADRPLGLLLGAAAAVLAAIAVAPEARAAADTAGIAPAPAPAPAATGLLRSRVVPAPVAGGKGPRRPSAAARPTDPLARRLAAEHVRARQSAGPPRRAFRTIVVCQRPGAPWRDRLAAYLDRLFAGDPPFRIVDAATLRAVPARATVAAFAADDAAALPCLDAAPGFRGFAETSPRPRRIFGRPVLCPSSVGLRGTRLRFYVADMTHPGRACEAARFGEILGLPGWARDPAENGDRLPAIRAHLGDLYAPPATTAGSAPARTGGGAADARGRIGPPPVIFSPR